MTTSPDVLQVYDRYIALASMARREFSGTLAGKLLLAPCFETESPQLIFAAGIATAASLVVESDALRIQEANRLRVCEFTVNTLDEAIRILKNQLRKRQPVAVLLKQDLAESLGEMLERGLQPDLAVVSGGCPWGSLTAQFVARGAKVVELHGWVDSNCGQQENGMLDVTWKILEAPGLWLPKVDALLADLFPDDSRSQWIRAAPLYLDRPLQFERFVRLSREEAHLFLGALKSEVVSIGAPVLLKIGGGKEQIISAH
jgi:hypothetical protein